ncbi:MAG TPA: hypothetical protein VED87_09905 [Methylocystis sp.]|nr:hypothetical protein [Methylocystis sp.]
MWREWLTKTLSPRRDEVAEETAKHVAPPELEGHALHPGANEFRAAWEKAMAENE